MSTILKKVAFAAVFLLAFLSLSLASPSKTKAESWTRLISGGEIAGTTGNLGIIDIKYSNGITYIMTIFDDEDTYRPRFFTYDGTTWTNITSPNFSNIVALGEIGTTDMMAIYNGMLCFGGTKDLNAAVTYCYSNSGAGWNQINQDSFGSNDVYIRTLKVKDGNLYASSIAAAGSKVWQYSGAGTDWTQINVTNFGQPVEGGYLWLSYLVEYNGSLYASSYMDEIGSKVWLYSGSGTDWSEVATTGFGADPNKFIFDMNSYNGYLYAVVSNWLGEEDRASEIWRYNITSGWERVLSCGDGQLCANYVWDMTSYKDKYLYASTVNLSGDGFTSNILQSTIGTDWLSLETISFASNPSGILCLGIMGENSYLLAGTFSNSGAELWMREIVVPVVVLPVTGYSIFNQNVFLVLLVFSVTMIFLPFCGWLILKKKS